MRKYDPCFKERNSFSLTNVSVLNNAFANSKCIKRNVENNGLLSYFVPENFIGLNCPKVNVHFSEVNLPRVSVMVNLLIQIFLVQVIW